MTANPPTGTLIASSMKTFVIIPNFYQVTGLNTFVYLDGSGNPLPLPIGDFRTIQGMQVNLAVPGSNLSKNSNQTVSLQVSLRNRKINL